jgi:rhodanese-related sulfurtransferase
MKHKQKKQFWSIIFIIFVYFILSIGLIGHCEPTDYINISVEEAWEFLRDTSNGIQIPIDVRTITEWNIDRIDTPFPEFPRHFVLDNIQDEEGYEEFISLFNRSDVILYCKAGSRSASAASILINRGFNGTVYNVLGGITSWKSEGFAYKSGNDAPQQPQTPIGPEICKINTPYTFSSESSDVNDDVIRLGWDWNGDDFIDIWTEYYPSSSVIGQENTWYIAGIFQIRALTEDHVGARSIFSNSLEIQVNTPPNIPTIQGPTDGKIGETYDYTISGYDEDNDQIYFYITWGDETSSGWLGPYNSEEEIQISHIWELKGTYTIKVISKDIYDAESEIITLQVNVPKTKISYYFFHHMGSYLKNLMNIFNQL